MGPRLLLLGGQAVTLGLAMAFLVVPSSSMFLDTYGADALPYAYLCVALAGVVVSALMTRAQRTWSLARVTVTVLSLYTLLVGVAWVVLIAFDATWVTFPLVVLFPLAIPIGFVLIGTQAGRLLDVRQMKASFPRVVAGFSVGFAVGGLAAAQLVGPIGGPERLLSLAVVAALAFLGLGVATARTFPAELATPPSTPTMPDAGRRSERRPALLTLLRNRMIVLIFGYQLLSAIVTQLLDFLVWERAATHYPDPADLARFLGLFAAAMNVISLAFVFLLAGRLLTRYGIRFGLAANPAGVLVLLVIAATVGYSAGPASTIFFVLVCAQQITDIVLTDGTTRTSVNATYQALPPSQRAAAQTWVEGVGFPLALGFTGAMLLVVDALDISVVTLVVLTAVLTVVWLALALAAYAGYGTNLRSTLTRRAWDPIALRLDDASREVVLDLVHDGSPSDLRVGLDVLADTEDPSLEEQVRRCLGDPSADRRLVAVSAARHAARSDPAASWVRTALEPLLTDPDPDVRASVEVAWTGLGTAADRAVATHRWVEAMTVDDPALAEALTAATAFPDSAYRTPLVALAEFSTPPVELADALTANADYLVDTVEAGLSGSTTVSSRAMRRIVGALGESGSPLSREVLLRHLGHPDRQMADAILGGLVTAGPVPVVDRGAVRTAVRSEAMRTLRLLRTLAALQDTPTAEHVVRGLRDDVNRSRNRAIGLLGLLHDHLSMSRTISLLGAGGAERPLALETLEVTVGRSGFPLALALLDPSLDDDARLATLKHLLDEGPASDASSPLIDLVLDPEGTWQDPWLRACGLHALAFVDSAAARGAASGLVEDPDAVTAETARWVMTTLARPEGSEPLTT